MIGSPGRFLKASLLFLTCLAATSSLHAQSVGEIVLKGPIESVSSQQMTITVLGQTLKVSSAVLNGVAPGNLVSLIKPPDQAAPYLAKSSLPYIPGGTRVFVSGIIAEVNRPLAKFRIGSLWIDYTRVLSVANFTPTVGMAAAALGTQPAPKGTLLAESATLYSPSAAPPITTTITQLTIDSGTGTLRGLEGGIVGGGIIGPTQYRRQIPTFPDSL